MSNSNRVAIIDVGRGNVASIQRMIEKVGGQVVLARKSDQLNVANKIILPGVGHFDEGMSRLREYGFVDALIDGSRDKSFQVLGICLGMQLLCRGSEEGKLPGLGLIDADVKKFRFADELNLKVPHMGWNVVRPTERSPLLPSSDVVQRFYFVHSYIAVPDDPSIKIGVADYGGEFCAAFQQDNLFGVQFHPEKSHRFGMLLMKKFMDA